MPLRLFFGIVTTFTLYPLIKFINSSRVSGRLKAPVKSLVVVSECCFCTPLICMHRCSASITTITPKGLSVFWIHSFICVVIRSCTCNLRAKTSTTRAILLSPVIFPFGMYATCAFPKNGSMWCSHSE